MNITITGNLGSGKSTVCKELKADGYTIISTGDIFREIAAKQGLSVVELNQKVEQEIRQGKHDIDDMIDNRSHELGNLYSDAVFDSRLAWHFVEKSFKVFLITDITEAAKRVLNAGRETEKFDSLEECRAGLLKRQFLEQSRFTELYGIDYYDMSNYNLILETTAATPKQIKKEILSQLAQYENGDFTQRILLNPTSVYPAQSSGNGSDDEGTDHGKTVTVGLKSNEWYALDGQQSVLSAIANKDTFLCVEVEPDACIPEISEEPARDFERKGQFKYRKYPSGKEERNLLHFL